MIEIPLDRSNHLHTFRVAERTYLVNASTGQAFLITAEENEPPRAGICAKHLRRFGHLGDFNQDSLDADAPPTNVGSVLLNVTHHCNLACAYCIMAMPDIRHAYHDEKHSLTTDTGKSAIDLLADVGDSDVVDLTFFGGEPLLKFDVIKTIVEYAATTYPHRFNYQLITNGCLLRPDMHDFFKEHRFSFLWSLDGEPQVHDRLRRFKSRPDDSVFAESFAALQALRTAWPDCRIGVNITYFKQTLELPAAVAFFRRHGIDAIRMDRGLVPRDSPHAVRTEDTVAVKARLSQVADDYLSVLLGGQVFSLNPFTNYMRVISKRLPRLRACNSGLDYVTIAPTGEIYSCYKLLGLPDCKLGDVEHGFRREASLDIWQRLRVTERPGCGGCWARFVCAGGCAADNRHLNGTYFVPARENCAIFLHAIELSIHLYFSLLETAPKTLKRLLGNEHLDNDDRPACRDEIVRVNGNGLIEHERTGGRYKLNEPAVRIFRLCDGTHSLAEIASTLTDCYGLPPTLALLDCREHLFRMAKAGLVAVPPAH